MHVTYIIPRDTGSNDSILHKLYKVPYLPKYRITFS